VRLPYTATWATKKPAIAPPFRSGNPEIARAPMKIQTPMSMVGFGALRRGCVGPNLELFSISPGDANRPGGVFHDPEADAAFRTALRHHLRSGIQVIEVPAHINAPLFTDAVLTLFLGLMREPAAGPRVAVVSRNA